MNSTMKKEPIWNKCDICGKIIPLEDFETGAIRQMITPDSDKSSEEYETLCREHGHMTGLIPNVGRGRSIEEPEHPAWKAWLDYSGHVPGTTMGIDSTWEPFKAGWTAQLKTVFHMLWPKGRLKNERGDL